MTQSEHEQGVVLIVDDTPTNLEVLFETLSSDGFKVLVAIDGESALEQAALAKPDVILLDIMMPEIDGFETICRLKSTPETSEIPVIFMTALSDTVDKVRGFELGAVDYITKPFQQKEVSIRVSTQVKFRAMQQELERTNAKLAVANDYLEQRVTERIVDLAEANTRMRKTNRALARFVPREFLTLLGRKDVTKLKLGDQVEAEATLMFVGIRGFTKQTQGMRPDARLAYLNRYMAHIAPAVREHGGFVDKYIGDALMALFPTSTSDAVEAALAIHEALKGLDTQTEETPLRVGIGLHCGSMLLGTIGEAERMESTVISEVVDCTAKLERLTKRFIVHTLLSGPMHDTLDAKATRWTRKIARIKFDTDKQDMDIYELFAGDTCQEEKFSTREDFEKGLAAYENSDLAEACEYFERVLAVNSEDRLARRLYRRSQNLLGDGGPAGWSGIYEVPNL
ncbi:MAG: response regulator [Nannocystaceae bacterium]